MAENGDLHSCSAGGDSTMGASATSAKYLNEIKAIYGRLKGEYDYLRKKQQQQQLLREEQDELEVHSQQRQKCSQARQSVERLPFNFDSDGLVSGDSLETNGYNGAQVDKMIASSVEELYDSENATLRERVAQLEAEVAAKSRDWRRIRANYEQLQESNEKLKQQLSESNAECAKLETRYKQLMNRFSNLQSCQRDRDAGTGGNTKASTSKSSVSITKPSVTKATGKLDGDRQTLLMNLALEALAEVAGSGTSVVHSTTSSVKSLVSSGCCPSTNLIFPLAELLKNLPPSLASQSRIVDPLLRLFYDSLPWLLSSSGTTAMAGDDTSASDLRPGVNLSLQKCGESLFRSAPPPSASASASASASTEHDGQAAASSSATSRRSPAVFFRSAQLSTRFLSTLVILRTVTRADILAQALECLLRDCQSEAGREAFVRYDAARVVVMYLRPHNKAFVGTSLGIIARLLTTSSMPPTTSFTEIFLTERFVCALSMLLDSPAVAGPDLEKLSTILAKLASTVKKPKSTGTALRLFNAFGITDTVQRMLKRLPVDEHAATMSPLVCSNLRHIVSHLSPSTPSTVTATVSESPVADELSCGSISLS